MSHERAQEAVDALKQTNGNKRAAARLLGIHKSSLKDRLITAAKYGLDGSIPEPLPLGMRVKATSTLYDAATGEPKLVWVKAREDQLDPTDLSEILVKAFDECKGGAKLLPPPKAVKAGRLAFIPVADLHMGLYSWHQETGNNWSLDRAMGVGKYPRCTRAPGTKTWHCTCIR